eukprot:213635_1
MDITKNLDRVLEKLQKSKGGQQGQPNSSSSTAQHIVQASPGPAGNGRPLPGQYHAVPPPVGGYGSAKCIPEGDGVGQNLGFGAAVGVRQDDFVSQETEDRLLKQKRMMAGATESHDEERKEKEPGTYLTERESVFHLNEKSLSRQSLQTTQIAKFKQRFLPEVKCNIGVNEDVVVYTVKKGTAIRVIHQDTGAKTLLKLPASTVVDLRVCARPLNVGGRWTVVVGAVDSDGVVTFWKVWQSAEKDDELESEVLINIHNYGGTYSHLRFKPLAPRKDDSDSKEDSSFEICLGSSKGLELWTVPLDRSGMIAYNENVEESYLNRDSFLPHSGCQCVVFDATGSRVASGSSDGSVKTWDMSDPEILVKATCRFGTSISHVMFVGACASDQAAPSTLLITCEIRQGTNDDYALELRLSDPVENKTYGLLILEDTDAFRADFNQVEIDPTGSFVLASFMCSKSSTHGFCAIHIRKMLEKSEDDKWKINLQDCQFDYVTAFAVQYPLISMQFSPNPYPDYTHDVPHTVTSMQLYTTNTRAVQQLLIDTSQCYADFRDEQKTAATGNDPNSEISRDVRVPSEEFGTPSSPADNISDLRSDISGSSTLTEGHDSSEGVNGIASPSRSDNKNPPGVVSPKSDRSAELELESPPAMDGSDVAEDSSPRSISIPNHPLFGTSRPESPVSTTVDPSDEKHAPEAEPASPSQVSAPASNGSEREATGSAKPRQLVEGRPEKKSHVSQREEEVSPDTSRAYNSSHPSMPVLPASARSSSQSSPSTRSSLAGAPTTSGGPARATRTSDPVGAEQAGACSSLVSSSSPSVAADSTQQASSGISSANDASQSQQRANLPELRRPSETEPAPQDTSSSAASSSGIPSSEARVRVLESVLRQGARTSRPEAAPQHQTDQNPPSSVADHPAQAHERSQTENTSRRTPARQETPSSGSKRAESALLMRLERLFQQQHDRLLEKFDQKSMKVMEEQLRRQAEMMRKQDQRSEAVLSHLVANAVRSEFQKNIVPQITKSLILPLQKSMCHVIQPALEKQIHRIVQGLLAAEFRSEQGAFAVGLSHLPQRLAPEIQASFRLCFRDALIPSVEACVRAMFSQVESTLKVGLEEHLSQFASQATSHDSLSSTLAQHHSTQSTEIRELRATVELLTQELRGVGGRMRDLEEAQNLEREERERGARASRESSRSPPLTRRLATYKKRVDELLAGGDIAAAVEESLRTGLVDLVWWVCSALSTQQLFTGPDKLDQSTVLSLITGFAQRLTPSSKSTSDGLETDLTVDDRLNWLREALLALQPSGEAASYFPSVLQGILSTLDSSPDLHAAAEQVRSTHTQLRMIRLLCRDLIDELPSPTTPHMLEKEAVSRLRPQSRTTIERERRPHSRAPSSRTYDARTPEKSLGVSRSRLADKDSHRLFEEIAASHPLMQSTTPRSAVGRTTEQLLPFNTNDTRLSSGSRTPIKRFR